MSLTKWQAADPVAYADEVLGLQLTPDQKKVVRAAAEHPRVVVSSGHKTGMTTALAVLAGWLAAKGERVAVVAPKRRQCAIINRELAKRGQKSPGIHVMVPLEAAGFDVNAACLMDRSDAYEASEYPWFPNARQVHVGMPEVSWDHPFRGYWDHPEFQRITLSSTGQPEVPGLAPAWWVDEKRREWGADSDVFRARVMGEFPRGVS